MLHTVNPQNLPLSILQATNVLIFRDVLLRRLIDGSRLKFMLSLFCVISGVSAR